MKTLFAMIVVLVTTITCWSEDRLMTNLPEPVVAEAEKAYSLDIKVGYLTEKIGPEGTMYCDRPLVTTGLKLGLPYGFYANVDYAHEAGKAGGGYYEVLPYAGWYHSFLPESLKLNLDVGIGMAIYRDCRYAFWYAEVNRDFVLGNHTITPFLYFETDYVTSCPTAEDWTGGCFGKVGLRYSWQMTDKFRLFAEGSLTADDGIYDMLGNRTLLGSVGVEYAMGDHWKLTAQQSIIRSLFKQEERGHDTYAPFQLSIGYSF